MHYIDNRHAELMLLDRGAQNRMSCARRVQETNSKTIFTKMFAEREAALPCLLEPTNCGRAIQNLLEPITREGAL